MKNKKETQKQEREWKPTTIITREKGFDSDGKKVIREEVKKRELDSLGRVKKLDQIYLETKLQEKVEFKNFYSQDIKFYIWKNNGTICEITEAKKTIFGTLKYNKEKIKIIYDKSGKEKEKLYTTENKEFKLSRNPLEEEIVEDEKKRIKRIIRKYKSSFPKPRTFDFLYNNSNKLEKVISYINGEPNQLQKMAYSKGGNIKITVNPFAGNTLIFPRIFYSAKEEKSISFYHIENEILNNARYTETNHKRTGHDKEGKAYYATLTVGWLEDIGSGRIIPQSKFSEIKIEK